MTANATNNNIYNICNYDFTGSCDSITKSMQSFFKKTSQWAQNCSTEVLKTEKSNAYQVCIGPKTMVGKTMAAVSSIATTAAPWVQATFIQLFTLYTLPYSSKEMPSGTKDTNPWAVASLVGSLLIPYLISSKSPTASSISSGGLLGAGVSALFGQNPLIGTLAGAVSKLVIDRIGNYLTAPVKKIYEGAEKTLKPYAKAADAMVSMGFVVGFGYYFHSLLDVIQKNPLTSFATAMTTGSQFHTIWKLYQTKGALALGAKAVSFCISHIHYPLIAYLTLAAQSKELQSALLGKLSEAPWTYTGVGIGALMILGLSLTEKAPPPIIQRSLKSPARILSSVKFL